MLSVLPALCEVGTLSAITKTLKKKFIEPACQRSIAK